jgi:hypothetical protein
VTGQPTRRAFLVAAATVPAAAVLLPAGQQRPEPPYRPGDIRPEPQQVELSYVTAGKVFTADQMNQVIRSIKQLQQREGRYRRA